MQRALCEDYLNDKLSVEERKAFEERLAMGDKELIETLKQLKAYRQHGGEFLGNEKFEDHNLLELVKESEHSEEQTKSKRNEQGLADTIQEIETRQQTKQKKSFSMFLGVLLIGLVLFVTYQQWNTYIVSSKNDLLLKKNAILEKERAEYQIANRNLAFYLERIKNLITSDFFTTTRLELKDERGVWLQLWDKGTLRTIVLVDKPQFKSNDLLQMWSQNARTREWQLVGSIDKIKADSVYTIWDTQMLARSKGIQIKLLTKSEAGEIVELVLAETKIK